MTDPLDELLAPTGPPASDEVRRRVLTKTLDALRGRRRPPYGAVGLLMAAIAAGVLMLAGPLPTPPAAPPGGAHSGGARPRPAEEIEWRALEDDPKLYREAAERYLDEGRPAEAVRCYGHALDESGDLEPKDGDGYLLMAIKYARKKERGACGH